MLTYSPPIYLAYPVHVHFGISSGIPAAPSFGELMSGSQAGQVVIQIKTVASGVSDPAAQGFEFIIYPVINGIHGNRLRFSRPNYQSNMFEAITISDLMPGQSYTFSATAMNTFGESTPVNSAPVKTGTCKIVQGLA